ncbi:sigma-E factor negative regulatory protein [Janthinobacterium sp. 17J80-10]|uniref:sigma-E factor negative regulatory protein n=1 Tax=Janthinobacterium sp. 17J80-10 TaxID=2497863 RepID=UPI0010059964|nr:sigma-E factor negative regulatory protein [Janthinobacterium sp. 17J80-10]QAU34250.1 histidine kinase [Janthinobacterium sp. 17J80-10]
MNTKERTQEQISALADDELSDSQIEVALAALRDPQARNDWDIYHQIGDVLRSDDMAFSLSEGFSARMAAALEAEPVILAPAPAAAPAEVPQVAAGEGRFFADRLKRFALPGVAAAAVATAVFVTAPQMLVAKRDSLPGDGAAVVAVAAKPAPAVLAAPAVSTAAASIEGKVVTLEQQQGEVLRDPRIDEYLMAHQRFSPSVYSSAQYARAATFASDTGK